MFYLVDKTYKKVIIFLVLLLNIFVFSLIMFPVGILQLDMLVRDYFLLTMGIQLLGAIYLEWLFSYTYNMEGKDYRNINTLHWIAMFGAKTLTYGTFAVVFGLVHWDMFVFILIFIFPLAGGMLHFLILNTIIKASEEEDNREIKIIKKIGLK
ncbi:hypothetical protein KK120_18690 [Virgibacillus dakarensis]|nr:hypothetical protein [Virgibacillus dakarensis]